MSIRHVLIGLAWAAALTVGPATAAQPPITINPDSSTRTSPAAVPSSSGPADAVPPGAAPSSSSSADTAQVPANPDAVPTLSGRVTDLTGTLNAASVQRIDAKLAALEKSKGAQIAVLMVPTTGDRAIEQYAVQVFDAWKLGRRGVDDGILLVVAKNDRTMRIEVGYGLEGAVTDAQASRIIREYITPRFAQGDFAAGIESGVDRLSALVQGEDLPAAAATRTDGPNTLQDLPGGVFAVAAVMLFALPVWLAVLAGAFIGFSLSASLPMALVGGVIGLVISLMARQIRPAAHAASRRGRTSGGWAAGGSRGGGRRSSSSSVFRGGGGRSGGGGASGRW